MNRYRAVDSVVVTPEQNRVVAAVQDIRRTLAVQAPAQVLFRTFTSDEADQIAALLDPDERRRVTFSWRIA